MPTLAEWDAARKSNQAPSPDASTRAASGAGPEIYHPGLADTPLSAGVSELARTGKEALIGLAKSPFDAFSALVHPVETVKGLASAVAHPIDTATSAAGAIVDPKTDPRAMGSLLGQVLIGKYAPDVNVSPVVNAAGRATSAVGRGMEAVGSSAPARLLTKYGPFEAAVRMDPKGVVAAAVPPLLKAGGQLAQRVGTSLAGAEVPTAAEALGALKRRLTPGLPDTSVAAPEDVVRETVSTARGYQDQGMSPEQAAQRSGWPLGQSEEMPYSGTQAGDVSLSPEQSRQLAIKRLTDAANREAATTDRTTGHFEEGPGGLTDISKGNYTRIPPPVESIGRPMNPAFRKFALSPDMPSNVVDFDAAKNFQVHDQLMKGMSTLTDEDIRSLDSVDDFGRPLSRADRGLDSVDDPAARLARASQRFGRRFYKEQ